MTQDSHDHDRGLAHDLMVLTAYAARRRNLLKWGLGLSALPLLACAASGANDDGTADPIATDDSGDDTANGASNVSCAVIPEETAGPYPGDGTNGANVLTLSGVVRSDIRSSIAGATGVAEGIELTITLTILDGQSGCEPLPGQAVYIWHCDRDGNYSMYSAAAADENYLRGVQETDENGQVTFTTIFPACYSGRWPHIHFEVYPSIQMATSGQNKVATSQLALPEAQCNEVFATDGYEQSVRNLSQISLATDNVFSDGVSLQVPSISGNVNDGYKVALDVVI